MTNLFWCCVGAITIMAIFCLVGWTIRRNRKLGVNITWRPSRWVFGTIIVALALLAGCGSYRYLQRADEHKLSDDTKQYVHTDWLPDYMTGPKEIDIFRRTQGSGIITAPDSTAIVMHVGLGNVDRSNPKRVVFGSCLTKFHYRYRWIDSGLWETVARESQPMEVVNAPSNALEIEMWMEMTDGTAMISTVKFQKYRVSPY